MIDSVGLYKSRENLKSTLKSPSVSTDQTRPMRSRLRKSDISLGQAQGKGLILKKGKKSKVKRLIIYRIIKNSKIYNI